MRNRTSAQAARIEAEYQARFQAALDAVRAKQDTDNRVGESEHIDPAQGIDSGSML